MKRWTLGFAFLLGAAAGGTVVKKLWLEKYREQKAELQISKQKCDVLYAWLHFTQSKKNLNELLKAQGYDCVSIFGMGREGRLLADVLGDMVSYGVELDNPNAVHERFTVYRLGDDPLPPADCMIVCDLERIQEKIDIAKKEFDGSILTLQEVLAL